MSASLLVKDLREFLAGVDGGDKVLVNGLPIQIEHLRHGIAQTIEINSPRFTYEPTDDNDDTDDET